jgi:alginate O-acetyltransferase complex protein AlgI
MLQGHKSMLFSSIIFICYFIPVFLAIYLGSGMRTSILLLGSVLFYTWGEGAYVFLLAALIVITYFSAQRIVSSSGAKRIAWLVVALIIDVGTLGVFKYSNFVADIINAAVGSDLVGHANLRLPLGISFFTFQLVSYLVDTYRNKSDIEHSLARFATYILMFPHLIAGPIVRYVDIREELASRHNSSHRLGLGLQYFIVGLCQKVLIANTLSPIADYAFSLSNSDLSGLVAWSGIVAYTLQIYFDFCGYSNMAIGLAFALGFTFPKNFDHPYASRSISEFWRRWHMSLSFWFRDYVYIPLGGNRGGQIATLRNLLIVFFLTGLWHGAAWNFVFWGMFHGSFLLIERVWLGGQLRRAPGLVSWAYTMLVVMIGWVFFKADGFVHAARYLHHMFSIEGFADRSVDFRILVNPEVIVAYIAGAIFAFPVLTEALDRFGLERIARSPNIKEERLDTVFVHRLPITLLAFAFVLCCALLASTTLNPFLYFRF